LVTTSPVGTARSEAGVLPGAEVLYSGTDGDPSMRSGARFSFDFWFSSCHQVGLEDDYTFLSNGTTDFERNSSETAILAQPFLNVSPTTSRQDAWLLSYPDGQSGGVNIHTAQELNFLETLVRCAVVQQSNRNLDFLIGYRYGRFSEDLSINDRTELLGSTIQKTDLFKAQNDFNGAELGFVASGHYCRWSLELLSKLALGRTHSRVTVAGATSVTDSEGGVVNSSGGLLALPSNSGIVDRDSLSVIPELGITLGYDLTCNLKATVGYTFVYWSSVMRPGDQIDTNINGTQIPPTTRYTGDAFPQSKAVMTDFWAQGFNVGLDYRY